VQGTLGLTREDRAHGATRLRLFKETRYRSGEAGDCAGRGIKRQHAAHVTDEGRARGAFNPFGSGLGPQIMRLQNPACRLAFLCKGNFGLAASLTTAGAKEHD
jgi:hypothetical protein